ncbi:hypothetical protein DFH06DRAFT_1208236 [Mycena polygramma]|nr:hypothetical protein DFH06DRAFT_1208236 [Mycena polygramma]
MSLHQTSSRRPTRSRNSASLGGDGLRTRLAQLDAEIEELQTSLYTRLNQLSAARVSVLNRLDSLVYPILTLPNEITAEIFLHYIADYPLYLPGSYRTLTGPPLLASVCRAWRHAALNLQAMWSNIRVDPFTKVPLLQCCLARAGRHALVLDIALVGQNAGRTCAALAPHSAQWETFECQVELFRAPLFLDNGVRGRTPLLKKLVVEGFGDRIHDGGPMTAFSEAPQLRQVELYGISSQSISLPWAQLTHLTCCKNNSAQIAEILLRTTHLQTLVLSDSDRFPRSSASPIRLHHLHTLELRKNNQVSDVLDRLTLPALKKIGLEGCGTFLSAVPRLLARSRCEPRSVSLTNSGNFSGLEVLSAVPTVIAVYLNDMQSVWLWRPFFERLTSDAEFLPNLQTLCMQLDDQDVPAQVADMLEARWGGGAGKLKSFKFRRHPESWDRQEDELRVSTALCARLQALAVGGLQLEMPGI